MVKEKKDLFVPLLPKTLTDKKFKEYREALIEMFRDTEEIELSLTERSFGISLSAILPSNKKFVSPDNFEVVNLKDDENNDIDSIDKELFEKAQFYREVWYSKKPLEKIFHNKKVNFYIYINISNSIKPKLNSLFIHTFTLTTFDPENNLSEKNYVQLSNKEVIALSKWWVRKCEDFEKLEKIDDKENFWKEIH